MMKIIGIVIISISTLLYSFSVYEKYKVRPDSLQTFIDLIECYNIQLKWHKKSFVEVLKTYDTENKYIKSAKTLLVENDLTNSFIIKNELYGNLFLLKEDELIIKNFLKNSGKQNYDSELSLCEKTLFALSKQKELANLKLKESGSLCLKLGGVAALWIFVLLI